MAVGQTEISLIHTSSGTTGSPKIFAYTGKDVGRWAANVATVLWINSFRKSDIVLSLNPFGEFTGGGGAYLGFIALGATYIPMAIGSGVTDKVMAHFSFLLDPESDKIPENFKLVYQSPDVVVYEIDWSDR
jgi:phenylacetate-CoA ligase